jgi:hypothetical protein
MSYDLIDEGNFLSRLKGTNNGYIFLKYKRDNKDDILSFQAQAIRT